MKGPGILEMLRATPAGFCPFCLEEIPPVPAGRRGPRPRSCRAPECLTAYQRTYRRDRRAGRLAAGALILLRRRGLELGTG